MRHSRLIYRRLRLPDSEIRILLQRTADPKTHKERMHLDLESDDVEAEVSRLVALGSTRWDHQQARRYDFWVLRVPWANEFCVLQVNFPRPPSPTRTLARVTSVFASRARPPRGGCPATTPADGKRWPTGPSAPDRPGQIPADIEALVGQAAP